MTKYGFNSGRIGDNSGPAIRKENQYQTQRRNFEAASAARHATHTAEIERKLIALTEKWKFNPQINLGNLTHTQARLVSLYMFLAVLAALAGAQDPQYKVVINDAESHGPNPGKGDKLAELSAKSAIDELTRAARNDPNTSPGYADIAHSLSDFSYPASLVNKALEVAGNLRDSVLMPLAKSALSEMALKGALLTNSRGRIALGTQALARGVGGAPIKSEYTTAAPSLKVEPVENPLVRVERAPPPPPPPSTAATTTPTTTTTSTSTSTSSTSTTSTITTRTTSTTTSTVATTPSTSTTTVTSTTVPTTSATTTTPTTTTPTTTQSTSITTTSPTTTTSSSGQTSTTPATTSLTFSSSSTQTTPSVGTTVSSTSTKLTTITPSTTTPTTTTTPIVTSATTTNSTSTTSPAGITTASSTTTTQDFSTTTQAPTTKTVTAVTSTTTNAIKTATTTTIVVDSTTGTILSTTSNRTVTDTTTSKLLSTTPLPVTQTTITQTLSQSTTSTGGGQSTGGGGGGSDLTGIVAGVGGGAAAALIILLAWLKRNNLKAWCKSFGAREEDVESAMEMTEIEGPVVTLDNLKFARIVPQSTVMNANNRDALNEKIRIASAMANLNIPVTAHNFRAVLKVLKDETGIDKKANPSDPERRNNRNLALDKKEKFAAYEGAFAKIFASRENLIQAICDYNCRYGDDFIKSEFSQRISQAEKKWVDRELRKPHLYLSFPNGGPRLPEFNEEGATYEPTILDSQRVRDIEDGMRKGTLKDTQRFILAESMQPEEEPEVVTVVAGAAAAAEGKYDTADNVLNVLPIEARYELDANRGPKNQPLYASGDEVFSAQEAATEAGEPRYDPLTNPEEDFGLLFTKRRQSTEPLNIIHSSTAEDDELEDLDPTMFGTEEQLEEASKDTIDTIATLEAMRDQDTLRRRQKAEEQANERKSQDAFIAAVAKFRAEVEKRRSTVEQTVRHTPAAAAPFLNPFEESSFGFGVGARPFYSAVATSPTYAGASDTSLYAPNDFYTLGDKTYGSGQSLPQEPEYAAVPGTTEPYYVAPSSQATTLYDARTAAAAAAAEDFYAQGGSQTEITYEDLGKYQNPENFQAGQYASADDQYLFQTEGAADAASPPSDAVSPTTRAPLLPPKGKGQNKDSSL